MHAKSIETDRVLCVVLAPLVVRDRAQRLEGIIVSRGEAAIDELLRSASRLGSAKIRGFEDSAQHALGRNRMFANEFSVARQDAAEILRPGRVDRAVEDHVADIPGAQLLRLRRTPEERVDLSVQEQLARSDLQAALDPPDVFGGVEPDMGGHDRHEEVRTRSQGFHPDPLAFEVGQGANGFIRDQFKAADMRASQYGDWSTAIDRGDKLRGEV